MIWLLLSMAHAQGLDAHQLKVVAYDGDVRDPLRVQRPGRFHRGDWFVGGIVEGSQGHVVRYTDNGESLQRDPWLTDVVALNLSGGVAAHDRLRVDLAAPVFLASRGLEGANGAAMGDLRLSAMGSLVRPRRYDLGAGLGLTAHLDLPTGASNLLLGQRSVAGGGALSFSYATPKVTPTLEAGLQFNPAIELHNLRGSDAFTSGVGLAFTPRAEVGVILEGRVSIPLTTLTPRATETLAETQLTVRYRHRGGGHLIVGGAAGLSPGAGAPVWRAFLGGGFGKVRAEPEEEPPRAGLEVSLTREDGGDVSGSEVSLQSEPDHELLGAYGDGPMIVDGLQLGSAWNGRARLGCFTGAAEVVLDQARTPMAIEMTPTRDTTVIVEVISESGPVTDATATWKAAPGCVESAEMLLEEGKGDLSVGEGLHELFVTAPGMELVQEGVTVEEEGELHIVVELTPTRVETTPTEILILEPVHFAFDEASIDPVSHALLNEVAANINLRGLTVDVGGHTDSVGSERYNLDLSQRRVDAVVRYLTAQDVPADQLEATAYGESQPIDTNETDAGRARNRRVVFRILEVAE